MLYAVKANRQYKITEDEKQRYINMGYKIAKFVDGKLIFEEEKTEESKRIAELEKENKELKAEIKKLTKELEKFTKGEGK